MTAPARVGQYRIERLLGTGSFATVWLGHDASLDARVAVKILADNWSHDLRVRERFLDEGRLLWRLDDPRLVRVHALGELPDGRPYLVMGWADRGSLRERLDAGPLPVWTALRLLREIAAGVAVLHRNGIVHRDLSLGNVLFRSASDGDVGPGEQVLIADLGLAKALAAASGLTVRAGTPGFMAPEQDDPFALVDARADVYGLGRLGIRLLAVGGGTAGGAAGVRLRDGVPASVADVLRTAVSPRPADRQPDAVAFGAALAQAVAGPGVAGPGRTVGRVAAAVAGLALLGGVTADAAGAGVRAGDRAVDGTGRISVTLPDGWRAVGDGWRGTRGADGGPNPALVISPDPDRWASDPQTPGAFVGMTYAQGAGPTAFVDARRPEGCVPAPVRTFRSAGTDWVVAAFTSCTEGKPVIVESAGRVPDADQLVYVQITPPAGSDDAFVDTLLAGVRVR